MCVRSQGICLRRVECRAGSEEFSQPKKFMMYGITHMLGEPEAHWMRGAGIPFEINFTALLPPTCAPSVALGDEGNVHCIRWPARAYTARAACPRGEPDVEPFSRDVLGLPMCRSTLKELSQRGGAPSEPRPRARAAEGAASTRSSSRASTSPRAEPCLVYSFGIGGIARWEHYMARELRCEVHAFDPTVKLREIHSKRASSTPGPRHGESALRPWPASHSRLFFHFAGLRGATGGGATGAGGVMGGKSNGGGDGGGGGGGGGGVTSSDNEQRLAAADNARLYGTINTSVLYTLPALMTLLGHSHRQLDVLKLDCEVCDAHAVQREPPDSLCLSPSAAALYSSAHTTRLRTET